MGRRSCGWCYEYGHNITTCKEYTEHIKQKAEYEVERNEEKDTIGVYDQHYQREYAKRIKASVLLDGTEFDKPLRSRSQSTRTCSYCGNAGHNRRKCEEYDTWTENVIKVTSDYRKAIKKQLQGSGWSVGALVQELQQGEPVPEDGVYMITEVDLNSTSFLTMRSYSDSHRRPAIKMVNINPNSNYWNKQREINLPPLKPENFPKSVKECFGEQVVETMTRVYERFPKDYALASGVDSDFDFPRGWTGAISSSKAAGLQEYMKAATGDNKWQNRQKAKASDY